MNIQIFTLRGWLKWKKSAWLAIVKAWLRWEGKHQHGTWTLERLDPFLFSGVGFQRGFWMVSGHRPYQVVTIWCLVASVSADRLFHGRFSEWQCYNRCWTLWADHCAEGTGQVPGCAAASLRLYMQPWPSQQCLPSPWRQDRRSEIILAVLSFFELFIVFFVSQTLVCVVKSRFRRDFLC